MYFANPWGLLGLLALPAILAIHLYHRRFPPQYVAGAHLWSTDSVVRMAGRRRDTLPITPSLLLELLSALLLTLALSEPRIGELDQVTHLVVVLDSSASMQGKPAGEKSFRDAALAELDRRLGTLDRSGVVTVIASGRRPVMLAGPAVPWSDARAALASWNPSLPRHSFASAWDLAQQLSEDAGELLFLTDRIPEEREIPGRMEVVSVGRQLENVAISTARWTFDSASGSGRIYLRVHNHGAKAASFTITGRSGEQAVFSRPMSLNPGASAGIEVPVPGGLQTLLLDIDYPADGLAIDNRMLLVEPKVRTVRVANLLADGLPRQLVERVLKIIPDVETTAADEAHIRIAPATDLPEANPALTWLGIGPLSTAESDQKQAKDLLGPFIIERQHPLMEGILLGGVVWGGVQPVSLSVTPLVSAGNMPLLAQLRGTRTTAYLMNIDLARSNLSESPDWPILLTNLVERRRDDLPGLRRWNYRLGEEIALRLFEGDDPAADKPLTLKHSERTRSLTRSSIIELPPLEETGLYELRTGDELVGQFAINFADAEESDLRRLAPGRHEPKVAAKSTTIAIDSPFSWVILIGTILILLALFADWYVLRPRRIH